MRVLILFSAIVPTLGCGPFCSQTLAQACASRPCPSTEAEARDCSTQLRISETTCGDMTKISWVSTDTAREFYFDATGKLVAEVDTSANGGGSQQCAGGPGVFNPPDCSKDFKTDCR